MCIKVWVSTTPDTDSPDVYPDGETVQEYGAGHLRVMGPGCRNTLALYAPGEWVKARRED